MAVRENHELKIAVVSDLRNQGICLICPVRPKCFRYAPEVWNTAAKIDPYTSLHHPIVYGLQTIPETCRFAETRYPTDPYGSKLIRLLK